MLELFHRAGWVAWPLGAFSILALGIVLERLFTLGRLKQLEERAFMMLQLALEKEDDGALADKQITDAPVTQVMAALAPMRGTHRDAIQAAADIALGQQRLRLRRYLSTLATIGSTAPFIGLFGTVLGVMSAFQSMGRSGMSGESMATGISEALSATALGLLVATPSYMAYNFLVGRVQVSVLQVAAHVARLTPLLERAERVKREAA